MGKAIKEGTYDVKGECSGNMFQAHTKRVVSD
jgi:hypothetical protein